jgi:hypothetical protein
LSFIQLKEQHFILKEASKQKCVTEGQANTSSNKGNSNSNRRTVSSSSSAYNNNKLENVLREVII